MSDHQQAVERSAAIKLQNKHESFQNLSIIASALSDELDEYVKSNMLTADQAQAIYRKFIQAYQEQFDILVNQRSKIEGSLTANLDMYRFFDDTADLELSQVEVKYTSTDLAKDPARQVKITDKLFVKAMDEDIVRGKKRAP